MGEQSCSRDFRVVGISVYPYVKFQLYTYIRVFDCTLCESEHSVGVNC